MTEQKDLIERLREENGKGINAISYHPFINPDGPEAADRIEALASELATLRAKLAERDALLRKRHDCLLQFVTQLAHAPRKPCTWMQIREAASDLLTQIDALTGGDNAEG